VAEDASPGWVDAVGQIFSVIPDLASPEQVERSLREILEDPQLEMFWWDWESGCYVDVNGRTRELEPSAAGRTVTLVGYETRKVGAVEHDAGLLDEPEFLNSFVPTIRIAMERDRLHRDLLRKLEELKASRLRIVTAADAERRRLERNLHDGAQQRLVTALLGLRRLEDVVAEQPDVTESLRAARAELEGAIEELRELARGLHPPLLARRGLAAAVRAATKRSAIPIELELDIPDELPPAIEAAAYYVCAEAVTNTVKHAQASQVWLTIARENGRLRVDVRDDGIGGACVDCDGDATGLGGLLDRVETLDGTLEVVSPEGGGTRLVATFPVG
jgi:signal transduction histidine kinase